MSAPRADFLLELGTPSLYADENYRRLFANELRVGASPAVAYALNRAYADRERFSTTDQELLTALRAEVGRIVSEGRAAFGDDDAGLVLRDAGNFVQLTTRTPCTGFLSASARARTAAYMAGSASAAR